MPASPVIAEETLEAAGSLPEHVFRVLDVVPGPVGFFLPIVAQPLTPSEVQVPGPTKLEAALNGLAVLDRLFHAVLEVSLEHRDGPTPTREVSAHGRPPRHPEVDPCWLEASYQGPRERVQGQLGLPRRNPNDTETWYVPVRVGDGRPVSVVGEGAVQALVLAARWVERAAGLGEASLLISDDRALPDTPSEQEQALLSALAPALLEAIDAALLDAAGPRRKKGAMLISNAMHAVGTWPPPSSAHVDLFARRLLALAQAGFLEAVGDVRRPRWSELRRPSAD